MPVQRTNIGLFVNPAVGVNRPGIFKLKFGLTHWRLAGDGWPQNGQAFSANWRLWIENEPQIWSLILGLSKNAGKMNCI
ncbi:hypothetical protein LF1_05750 [Rubripirellula obstinata]|uniref:Uncharacterized protein n=1 Tax=Rubripirellula obstinata TaxID=406547 RepID=A0A5B1CEN3_9BACT|nr:hypothetical protein LF1_05750 [Rubripirellula obstinata]